MKSMHWNGRLPQSADLYLVLDAQVCGYDKLIEILQHAVHRGVSVVQLRDKSGQPKDIVKFSREALKITKEHVPFIINDSPELAAEVGADGVHLGQEDGSVQAARATLGDQAIIGRSCQNLEHARQAVKDKADYIGFGSVFKTLTKPGRSPMDFDLLKRAVEEISIPMFAIGGITIERTEKLMDLGVNRIALTRAVCEAEDPAGVIKNFRQVLDRKLARS